MRRIFAALLLALAALAAGLDGARLSAQEKAALPADLDLVPRDGTGFVALRIAATWNSAGAANLRKLTTDVPEFARGLQEMEKEIGLTVTDIDRLLLILPPIDSSAPPLVVFTTVKPFDRAKVLAALVPGAEEKKVQGKTYLVSAKKPVGVYPVNDRTFLVGQAGEVEKFLQQPAKKAEGTLSPALTLAAASHAMVLGLSPSAIAPKAKQNSPPDMKPLLPLFDARSGSVLVDADKELQINVKMSFATEDAAREGEKAGAALLDLIRTNLPKMIAQLEKAPKEMQALVAGPIQTFKEIQTALKTAAFQRKGMDLQGSMQVKTAEPASSFVLIGALFFVGRAAPAAPPPPPGIEKPIKKEQ